MSLLFIISGLDTDTKTVALTSDWALSGDIVKTKKEGQQPVVECKRKGYDDGHRRAFPDHPRTGIDRSFGNRRRGPGAVDGAGVAEHQHSVGLHMCARRTYTVVPLGTPVPRLREPASVLVLGPTVPFAGGVVFLNAVLARASTRRC